MLLVTGITGLTGKFLYKEMKNRLKGKDIKFLVRQTSDVSWMEEENLVYGDLKTASSIRKAFKDVNTVLHLAPRKELDNVLASCKFHGIKRIYYINSTGIYSKFKKSTHIDLRNETTLKDSGLIYTIIRPTMIYGNHQDGNIHLLIKIMDKTFLYPLIGEGKGLMHPIYARDLARVIVSALINEKVTRNREYNVAGKEPIQYSELLKEIAKNMDKKVIFVKIPYSVALFLGRIGDKIPNRIINYEKVLRLNEDKTFDYSDAVKDLAFYPISFKEGIILEIKELRKLGIIK